MAVYRKTKYPKQAMLCKVEENTFYTRLEIIDDHTEKEGTVYFSTSRGEVADVTISSFLEITRLDPSWGYYGKKPKEKVLPAAFIQGF